MKITTRGAVAALSVGVIGALMVPTAANATQDHGTRGASSTVISEHGVAIPENPFTPLTSENVEGGQWNYGTKSTAVWQKAVYSDYFHRTKKHGSSVKTGAGILRRSADTGKNSWARVAFQATANGNKAYYRIVK